MKHIGVKTSKIFICSVLFILFLSACLNRPISSNNKTPNQLPNSINVEVPSESIEQVTKKYIKSNIFPFSKDANCSYKLIEEDEKDSIVTRYLMVYAASGPSSALVPVGIVLKREGNQFKVLEFRNPLTVNESETANLFPEHILNRLRTGQYSSNEVVEELKSKLYE